MSLTRLIITGANGSGKTHFATQLERRRPDLTVTSYDALRLTQNWVKRPQEETTQALDFIIQREDWILEGGPSLLEHALPRCDGVIWLDPPEHIRAWWLAIRPWQNFGHVRAELPEGNVDWPVEQYRFALRSLAQSALVRETIERSLRTQPHIPVWRCRTKKQTDAALREALTAKAASGGPK